MATKTKKPANPFQCLVIGQGEAPLEHPYFTRQMHKEWLAENTYEGRIDSWITTEGYDLYERWLQKYHYTDIPRPADEMTTSQVNSMMEMIAAQLRLKGYDTVEDWHFSMTPTSYRLSMECRDDFQKDIPYEWRAHQGFEVSFRQVAEVWEKLEAVPGRERRELEVLLRQTNSIGESAKGINSAMAKAFAKELMAAGQRYQNMLTKG